MLQRCIYGAEKDPFAAELAKVALWIHCVVPDQPLTFLDHHIVCGDSLVGWPLLNVPNTIPDAAFNVTAAKGAERSMLTKALRRNQAVQRLPAVISSSMDQSSSLSPCLPNCSERSAHQKTCAARPPPIATG